MIDYRLKENRMEVFKDLYWLHTRFGIHPGLVYLYLPEMTKGMTQEQKYWVAFLEGCTQNPNTVWAILKYFPNRPYTEQEVKYFSEFHDYAYDKLDYDTDRIRWKGKLVQQLIKYNELIGESQVDVFERQLYDIDPKKWFTNVFEFVLNKVWGFGRMSAWSYTEFIKISCNLGYQFDKYYMEQHDSSMSMRNGLLLLYGYDNLHIWKELPNNPTSHSKELMAWAEVEVKALEEYLKTQYQDITVTAETLESVLCAFKNMIRGRRYPNIYTDMSYDRIKKAESLWGDKIDFSLFWKVRETSLPLQLLKEYNYGGYIDDPMEKAVNKPKQMYFRNTGNPLFLDLFFPKYNIGKPQLYTAEDYGRKIIEEEVIPYEDDVEDMNLIVGTKEESYVSVEEKTLSDIIIKGNVEPLTTVKTNKLEDYADQWHNIESFTKEEIRAIRKNNTKKQDLVGKTIFNELGFNTSWEDKIYELTPIELKKEDGKSMYFKRDDYFAPLGYGGINGSKLRQALYLGSKQLKDKGWDVVLTGATSISPQLPMTCAIAKYYGFPSMGLSSANNSDMLEISRGFGGKFEKTAVAYNTYVQKKMGEMKQELENEGYKPFMFHYGLSIDIENSSKEDIEEFYGVGANQVKSLIGTNIEDLIIALGSANSATSVMFGLLKYHKELPVKNLYLIGVGPNTYDKLINRLELLSEYSGIALTEVFNFDPLINNPNLINVIHYDPSAKKLWEYTDRIYEKFSDIDMHYTYEGKMLRFIRIFLPQLIKDTSCFWIIGSGLDKKRLEPYYNVVPKAV